MSNTRHTEISVAYTNSRTKKTYSLDDRVEEIAITDNAVGEGDTVAVIAVGPGSEVDYTAVALERHSLAVNLLLHHRSSHSFPV